MSEPALSTEAKLFRELWCIEQVRKLTQRFDLPTIDEIVCAEPQFGAIPTDNHILWEYKSLDPPK